MKYRQIIPIFFLLAVAGFLAYFFVGGAPRAEKIIWGINFSQKHTEFLKLDWKQTYLAILDDLKAKDLKILVAWDWIEGKDSVPYFDDLDWQIKEAEKRQANVVLVIGMKTGRWPECHIPEWAKNLNKEQFQESVLNYIRDLVLRYQNSDAVKYWQVENEPFFSFGVCPATDKDFFKKEIALVKANDYKKRPVIVSDSGEGSTWMEAAKFGDILGITMYRKTHNSFWGVVNYIYPPVFYWRKAQIIKAFFNKEVICGELQAEPWSPVLLYDSSVEEQKKTLDLEQFKKNIAFAEKTGLSEFYLWGAEWWYWMKEKQNDAGIWNEARNLFID